MAGNSERGLRHPMAVALIAALVSALIGAGATVWAARQGKLDAIASPPTTTVSVPGPTVTTTVTATSSPSTTGGVATGTNTGAGTAGDSLAELRPITGRMDKGPFAIHAKEFGDGLYRNIGVCNRTISATWDLGRKYQRFNAVIGLTDKSPDATLKVKFTAYVTDGTSRTATEPVVLGKYQPHSLQVDLDQADALELEAVLITSKGSCSGAGAVAWGDPRLYAE